MHERDYLTMLAKMDQKDIDITVDYDVWQKAQTWKKRKKIRSKASKLTADQVVEILRRIRKGEYETDLAKEFGVTKQCISLIVRGHTWRGLNKKGPRSARCRGSRCKSSVLTEKQVVALRKLAAGGATITDLQRLFGCAAGTLKSAIIGETWAHVPGALPDSEVVRSTSPKGCVHYAAKLVESDVIEVRRRYAEGSLQRELAVEFGVSSVTISLIVNGKAWKHVKEEAWRGL